VTNTQDIRAHLTTATRDTRLLTAALALHQNRLQDAEPLLRAHLYENPFDFAAIRMMAELAARVGRNTDAEALLRRALELAPQFGAARANLATLLYRTNRPIEALAELDALGHEADDDNPNLRAAAHNRLGAFDEALAIYADVLTRQPNQPAVWMSYGHVLKTVGRLKDGVAAYRRAIELRPAFGEAWWSLANLKTVRLDATDIETMASQLRRDDLDNEDRFHLEFAMGKALEDAGDIARAFQAYATANTLRRSSLPYRAAQTRVMVDRALASFTRSFFSERLGQGCDTTDPIFIIGMPRAGSTLIEQILASHSQVEAIAELPDIPILWAQLGDDPYNTLATMNNAALRELGEAYLARVVPQRRTDRPYFIDKLPNNWAFVGFIKAILPDAKIIDARRHPLSCGFSNFKQHFARGQAFSYDLTDIGLYYANYVRLLSHFDAALPGQIHRVIYERMVADTETEIRGLLAAVGLPFEQQCLRFHETERAVRTPSSEQVRSPIFTSGVDNWQAFAPWLDPLKDALGDVLTAYPDAPKLSLGEK
jgi:Tfp pilus assembly protein PilF